jgi:CRISPR/Cas system-associated exonuclease Cas4 (RecB family)
MVDILGGKYLFQKRGVYYFSKQIPKDVRQHYSQNRILQSLKTKSLKDAYYHLANQPNHLGTLL